MENKPAHNNRPKKHPSGTRGGKPKAMGSASRSGKNREDARLRQNGAGQRAAVRDGRGGGRNNDGDGRASGRKADGARDRDRAPKSEGGRGKRRPEDAEKHAGGRSFGGGGGAASGRKADRGAGASGRKTVRGGSDARRNPVRGAGASGRKSAAGRKPAAGPRKPLGAKRSGGRKPAANNRKPVAGRTPSDVCALSHKCGCCSQIDVPYADQLTEKQQRMTRLFAQLSVAEGVVEPIVGMEEPLRFRNKIASPFAPGKKLSAGASDARRAGGKGSRAAGRCEILCGMYAAGTHRIVPCDDCVVEHEAGRRVVRAVKQIMGKYGIAPYDEDAQTGFLRYVVVRVGHVSGEVLVTVVTADPEFNGSRNFCRELVRRCPEVTTVVQNINTRVTNAILGSEERVLYGPGFILDELCGLSFRVSSHSFYQVNSVQTERLYLTAMEFAGFGTPVAEAGNPAGARTGNPAGARDDAGPADARTGEPADARDDAGPADARTGEPADARTSADPASAPAADPSPSALLTVLDAYCGTGTIGLVAASKQAQAQVIGVDNVESAIADAKQNAAHNGIKNAEFYADDAGAFMRAMAAEGRHLDVLFMDPPRAGSSVEFLEAVVELAPQRIVYISCNPETQVRDARILQEGGYAIDRVRPVDMFPHTDHVETVMLLTQA